MVELRVQDLRVDLPEGPFDLVACRNLAFTYFDAALQRRILEALSQRLHVGGALVVGAHECLPVHAAGLTTWSKQHRIYRK